MTARLLLLAALAFCVSAVVAQTTSPAKDPSAPKDDLKYMGDPRDLRVIQDSPAVTFYADGGEGTEQSPRHVYFKAKMDGKPLKARPVLLFSEPPDEHHPVEPEKIQLSELKMPFGGTPFQIWTYPDRVSIRKGMVALVLQWSKGKALGLRPLAWWGTKRNDFDSLTKEENAAAVADEFR